MKANSGSHCNGKRDCWLDAVKLDCRNVNISVYPSFPVTDGGRLALQHMVCSNIAVVKGLDVTLDGSAVHARRWTQDRWLDASAQSIRSVYFVLDLILQISRSNNWDWLTITRRSSEKPICGTTADALIQSNTSSSIKSSTSMTLPTRVRPRV